MRTVFGAPRDDLSDATSPADLPVLPTWRTQWVQMTSPYSVDRISGLVGGAAARGDGVGVPQARGTADFYLVGRVRGTRIRLAAQRPLVRNSFAPELRGSLVPYGGGSLLTARLGPPTVVMAFMALWMAGVVAVFGLFVVLLIRDVATGRFRVDDLSAVGVAGGMAAFGTALLVLGRRWGRPYSLALRTWLENRCRMTEFVQDADGGAGVAGRARQKDETPEGA